MREPSPGALAGRRVLLVTFGSVHRPDGGLAVRARATIEALAALGAHLTVVSHHEALFHEAALPGDVDLVTLSRPLHLGFSTELVAAVRAGARQADLIVVESALFLPAVLAAGPSAPIVWDTNECETLHYRRLPRSPGNLARRLAWHVLEGWAGRRVALAVAISETEADVWRRLFPPLAARTVTVAHRAHVRPASPWRPAGAGPDTTVLLFVGNAVGKHNARAVAWLTEVLAPQLPASTVLVLAGRGTDVVPAATVAGPGPTPAVPGATQVVGLGLVDDIDAVIAGADICLAPLHAGAGVKTKVLHYLAHGKVVIATPAALEGIEDAPGVTVAEMDRFAAAVLAMVGERRAAVGRGPAAGRGPGAEEDGRRARADADWLDRRHGAAVVAGQWADALRPLLDRTPGPAAEVPSISWLARGLRAEARNWLPLGLLGWVVLPSRLPPRRGLLHRPIGRRKVTVRLRSGQTVTCRVAELFAVIEVFAVATYDRAGIDWAAARTIVDVGANIGAATVWMARRAPNARVVAVEPSPHALPLLRENVAANGLADRVTVVPCAVAAAPGTARLAATGTSVSGRVVADGASAGGDGDLVAARTLPSILRDAGVDAVDILKLDCEGAEFAIIETMAPTDLARVGAIVGEYHTFNGRQPRELRPPLAAAGFAFSWSGGGEIGTFTALRRP